MSPRTASPSVFRVPAGRIAVVLFAALAAGCTQYQWVHPTKTPAQYGGDRLACESRAAAVYPTMAAVVRTGGGYVDPGREICSRGRHGYVYCRSTPPTYIPPTYSTRDINAEPRERLIEACLYQRGYSLVPVQR
jgi:hypothetical protein